MATGMVKAGECLSRVLCYERLGWNGKGRRKAGRKAEQQGSAAGTLSSGKR